MQTFLIVLIALAALATLGALIRGIVIFLRTTEADLMGTGASQSSIKQNKAMQARIGFQALAVILVVLFLLLSQSR
jgi:hypothetical protein